MFEWINTLQAWLQGWMSAEAGLWGPARLIAFQGGEEGGVHAGNEQFEATEAEDINQEKIVRRKK